MGGLKEIRDPNVEVVRGPTIVPSSILLPGESHGLMVEYVDHNSHHIGSPTFTAFSKNATNFRWGKQGVPRLKTHQQAN